MQSLLTIQLLGWNSEKDLEANMVSLQAVPKDVPIRYIDNASTDNSVSIVQSHLPQAEILTLKENVGYAGGHNIGFSRLSTPFVLILNPDVEIVWSGIERLIDAMHQQPKTAAIQGILYRDKTRTIVDSTGIVRTASCNGIDRGANQEASSLSTDLGQPSDINATTGACSILRQEALASVAHTSYTIAGHTVPEVFDQDFFAYKEDVDLGWRFEKKGWNVRFEPIVTGYHRRVLKQSSWGRILQRVSNPRTKMSFRNYVWLILKNASAKDLFLHFFSITVRLATFLALSLVYWPFFQAWAQALQGAPRMLEKRGKIG